MDWRINAILAAVFASATAILAKLGVQEIPSNLATLIRTAVVLVLLLGIVTSTREYTTLPTLNFRTWLFLLGSGLCTGFSWLFYFKAIQKGPISSVAPIDKSSLGLTVLLGILIFSESFTWKTILGTLMILGGTIFLIL